jgi:hypothetical protein
MGLPLEQSGEEVLGYISDFLMNKSTQRQYQLAYDAQFTEMRFRP